MMRTGRQSGQSLGSAAEHSHNHRLHEKKQTDRRGTRDGETALMHQRDQDKIQRHQQSHSLQRDPPGVSGRSGPRQSDRLPRQEQYP